MSNSKKLVYVGLLIATILILSACAGPAGSVGPAGPEGLTGPNGPAGSEAIMMENLDQSCNQCHNDTSLINSKSHQLELSAHGNGITFLQSSNADCSGCHSGRSFSEMVASGLKPENIIEGDDHPTRQDCRTCHQIHTSYTIADWSLETSSPVILMLNGMTFDGGSGNLCVNCHQPRKSFPSSTNGLVSVDSTNWGPHYGTQSTLLLATGGAGLEGIPSAHYTNIIGTCQTCHMGYSANSEGQPAYHFASDKNKCATCHMDNSDEKFNTHFIKMDNEPCENCHLGSAASHTFKPYLAACTSCHIDASSFDINGVQTEVAEKLNLLAIKLKQARLLSASDTPVIGEYPEAQAASLWNYLYIKQDKSNGVHNYTYANALLDAALAAFP